MHQVSSSDWALLLASAREGDQDASNQIWDQLRDYLLVIADQKLSGNLRRKVDASDIVQQTLMEAQSDFDSFEGDESAFRAWLRKLVENNVTDTWRRFSQTQQRDVSREVSFEGSGFHQHGQLTASSVFWHRETDEQILEAVQTLPQRRRQVIDLRHRLGLSYAEIGIEMGMTEVAARKLWSRTIEQLRQKLTRRHGSQPDPN